MSLFLMCAFSSPTSNYCFASFDQFEPHLFVYGSTSLGTVAALRTNRSDGFDELFLAGAFDTVSLNATCLVDISSI